MTADTPYQWLSRVAEADPGRACLVDDTSQLGYGAVAQRVDARADAIRRTVGAWEIVPSAVSIGIDSIVEILAIQHAGAVPFPYTGTLRELPVAVAPETAVCIATSGSGGTPKLVPLSFTNIAASVNASRSRLGNGPGDRWLVCLPLDHVGGLGTIWRTLEAGGASIVAPFDASGSVIERHGPTIASMVPTMVRRLMDANPKALASIGFVLVGGGALGTALSQRCTDARVNLVPTYGLTEAGSQVATVARGVQGVSTGFVGAPLDGMEVEIIGRNGEPLRPGSTGLISIGGPAVFDGYLGEDVAEGRFVTNDLGHFDGDGNLYIEGRSDDVIVSGGENVSLVHVAETIGSYDGVSDVCVVGVDDADWGTMVCVMVVPDRGLAALDTMVARGLKAHERPKRWLERDRIPRLANGKHDLAAVKAAFEEEP